MPDKGYEDVAIQRINGMLDPMAKAMAQGMGMPPGGQKYSESDELEQWNYSPIADPRVRVEAMLELKQLGKTDEEITDAVYPNRRRLIATGRPQISAQISFAKQMDKKMAKLGAQFGQEQGAGLQAQPFKDVGADFTPAPTMAPSPAPAPAEQPEPLASAPIQPPSILDQPVSGFGG